MLLSDGEIHLAIANGDLHIDPPLERADPRLQPASIDLRLGAEIQVPKDSDNRAALKVDITKLTNFEAFIAANINLVDITQQNGIDFKPGDFILAKTMETVRLSTRLSGRVEGRSRLARFGIGVHITAPKIDPGFRQPDNSGDFPSRQRHHKANQRDGDLHPAGREAGTSRRPRLSRHFSGCVKVSPVCG